MDEAAYLGLARTIYIRCVYGIFGREITIYTVIYGVYIRFWPTLRVPNLHIRNKPYKTWSAR
jgi:hypothetical protein